MPTSEPREPAPDNSQEPELPTIPDDASELAADERALARERRVQARKDRLRGIFLTRHWKKYGMSGPLVVAILAALTLIPLLVLVLPQAGQTPARPVPLAHPTAEAGEIGGLLPDLTVERANGSEVALRTFRPAVIVLLPATCECDPVLQAISVAAAEHGVRLVLLGAATPSVPSLGGEEPVAAADPAQLLRTTYAAESDLGGLDPDDALAVLVRDDGVVSRALPAADLAASAARLNSELRALVQST